jgi:hypothetical protein
MKNLFNGTKWHTWLGVILSLPVFIVGATAVLIAFQDSYKGTESEPYLNVSWLPGYSNGAMKMEGEMQRGKIKSSLLSSDGKMYYGTKAGVIVVENGKAKEIPSFAGMDVFTISEFNNEIFVGTKMGLYKYTNEKATKLFDKETHHLDIRKDGSLAISTNKEMYYSNDNGSTWKKDETLAQLISTLPTPKNTMMEQSSIPMHKFVMDLHTGKAFFGKSYENIWIILVGLSICFLTGTGIFMWYKRLRKKSQVAQLSVEKEIDPKQKSIWAKVAYSVFILVLIIFLVSCGKKPPKQLSEKDIPEAILTTYKNIYTGTPDSTKWMFHSEKKEYEAKVYEGGKEIKMKFIENGELTKKEISLNQNELDIKITEYISSNSKYSGFNFKRAKIKEERGNKTIEVELTNNQQKYKLVFDTENKFMSDELKEEKKKE